MNRVDDALRKLPAVNATINYLGQSSEPPYMYYVAPPEGQPYTNVIDDPHEVDITDVSAVTDKFSLSDDGFQFVAHEHEFSDFYDDDKVRSAYFRQIEALFRDLLGIEDVVAYDYAIRRPDHGDERPDGIPVAGAFRRPLRRAHGDFDQQSGERFGQEVAPSVGLDAAGKRYRGFNLWRPIRGPLTDAPLALCHPASVAEDDLVSMRLLLGDREGHIIALRHNPAHRWLYRRGMEASEAVVFSSFDSTLPCARGVVVHTAFDDPGRPADGLPRESIEVRVIAVGG